MAVILEEKRKGAAIINILSWLFILFVIFVAVYYIFFQNPEKIDVRIPPSFENVQKIVETQVNIDPEAIINSPAFEKLRQYVDLPEAPPDNFGRNNPFVPLEMESSNEFIEEPLPPKDAIPPEESSISKDETSEDQAEVIIVE